MKISQLIRTLPLFMTLGVFVLTASPALSKDNGKAKAKGKVKTTDSTGNHGREAGELPYGLEQYSEKKGELPAGLQKKKDEDGSLTRGLEEGGKELKTTNKAKKNSKK